MFTFSRNRFTVVFSVVILTMFALYRASASNLINSASRRAYQSTSKILKSTIETPATKNVGSSTASKVKSTTSTTTTTSATSNALKVSGGGKILSFPKEHPFAFQMMVATAKTSAADIVVQVVAEGKSFNEIDWKRNGIFVVFGFAYLGGFQWWIMVNKYRQWFPTMDKFAKMSLSDKLKWKAGMLDACKMVLFDVLIHLPLMYFPTYYTVKEFVGGTSWNPITWVQDGVSKYTNNAKDDLSAMIKLWGPSDCIQFMLPLHVRMPFRHLVSFFWTAYVSFTRGSYKEPVAAAATAATSTK